MRLYLAKWPVVTNLVKSSVKATGLQLLQAEVPESTPTFKHQYHLMCDMLQAAQTQCKIHSISLCF